MKSEQELGKILNVGHEGLDDAVKQFVAEVQTNRGGLNPVVFLRATRNPKSGDALPKPTLVAVGIEGNYEEGMRKEEIAFTVRKVAAAAAAEWVVFLLPGILILDGEARPIVLCVTEHDGGESAFAGFVCKEPPSIERFQAIVWSQEQAWLRGMMQGARNRRLDLS